MRFLFLILTLCTLLAMPAGAQETDLNADRQEPIQIAQNGCTSLSQAVEQVRRRTGGRIISAETKRNGNREVHHIKVLTDDGKVKTHKVQGCKRGNG